MEQDIAGGLTSLPAPSDDVDQFAFIDPPFALNAGVVAAYPVEVSGNHLLRSMCRRLGWSELAGKRLIDFGCGVRFARTIVNLAIEIGQYVGVDVDQAAIAWLSTETRGTRLSFEHLDMHNPHYSLAGNTAVGAAELQSRGLTDFDAACMFSVITHQVPDSAKTIFAMLHRCVKPAGQLYFTAFIDPNIADYREGDPAQPCHMSYYNPDYLIEILASTGWRVETTYPLSMFQQPAFVCRKISDR